MSTLIERLRAGAADGYYPAQRQAGLELLIADAESAWLDNQHFIDTCINDDGDVANIDWLEVRKELDAFELVGDDPDARMILEWAEHIANRNDWSGIDTRRAKLIVEAVYRAFNLNSDSPTVEG
ncbi:hypothetical protein AB0392_03000 [Nonomuraea angiospora]|uniref:hypothetical protein n=1 Tax=Nonomuraea angiospora TaxID=46172 RepID=UPI00344D2C7E